MLQYFSKLRLFFRFGSAVLQFFVPGKKSINILNFWFIEIVSDVLSFSNQMFCYTDTEYVITITYVHIVYLDISLL